MKIANITSIFSYYGQCIDVSKIYVHMSSKLFMWYKKFKI
jgi:hypothetical protein